MAVRFASIFLEHFIRSNVQCIFLIVVADSKSDIWCGNSRGRSGNKYRFRCIYTSQKRANVREKERKGDTQTNRAIGENEDGETTNKQKWNKRENLHAHTVWQIDCLHCIFRFISSAYSLGTPKQIRCTHTHTRHTQTDPDSFFNLDLCVYVLLCSFFLLLAVYLALFASVHM